MQRYRKTLSLLLSFVLAFNLLTVGFTASAASGTDAENKVSVYCYGFKDRQKPHVASSRRPGARVTFPALRKILRTRGL